MEQWDKMNDYIDLRVKDAVLFEDTAECLTRISDMTAEDIRVDYSVEPPVMHIGKATVNTGDVVGVL